MGETAKSGIDYVSKARYQLTVLAERGHDVGFNQGARVLLRHR